MTFYTSLIITSVIAVVSADYECLCNYHVELPVYPKPDNQTTHIGSLFEFDCKPTYQFASDTPHWQAIQYEHQVGYAALDIKTKVQTCPGLPNPDDLVLATTPDTTIVYTSQSTRTSTSTEPSSTMKTTLPPTPSSTYHRTTKSTTSSPSTTVATTTMSSSSTTVATMTMSSPSTTESSTVSTTQKQTTTRKSTTPTTRLTSTTAASTTVRTTPTTRTTRRTTTTKSSSTSAVTTKVTTPPTTSTTSSTTTATTTRALQCPPQVQRTRYLREFGSHCYQFIFGTHRKWSDAEKDCNARGGHLVSIGSQAEQDFVYHSLKDLHFHGDKGIWTGLTDQNHEGTWRWSSGERTQFTYWASGQPGIFGSLEDCALLEMNENGHWGDYSCSGILFTKERHGYVCEYNKI